MPALRCTAIFPMTCPADDTVAVLAVIEALREHLAARRVADEYLAAEAEAWRRAQLFPPTAEQVRTALSLMSKTPI